MIEKTTVCSPIPFYTECNYSNHSYRNQVRKSYLLALFILCIGLTTSSAIAQSNAASGASKPEERQRRVETQQQSHGPNEASQRADNNTNRAASTPTVKKTVMIYTPPAEGRGGPRTALVDDIVIISRADDVPASNTNQLVRPTAMVRGMSAPASMPSIWPVTGVFTSCFGSRGNPFGGGSSEFHKGQDIAAPIGTAVMATADGVIVIAGWQRGYGRVVYIDHGNGMSTRYGHLSRIDVAEGQTIKRGEQVGLVGSSGRSTGPHLHYEVRINGTAVNPVPYLPILTTTTTATTTTPATTAAPTMPTAAPLQR